MIVKILGSGCSNCNRLEALTKEILDENSVSYDIEHVKELEKIMSYGVMKTPALVVDEKVIVSGRIPSKSDLRSLLIK